jgi:hypothetical protein
MRTSPHDAREYPSIRLGTGENVPLTYAAAGVRRILSVAYLTAESRLCRSPNPAIADHGFQNLPITESSDCRSLNPESADRF